jgi:hypothetical protein
MNRKLLLLSVAAMLISFPLSSRAETVSTTADLQSHRKTAAYLFSRPMLETMYRRGLEQDRKLGLQADCKSQYRVKPFVSLVLSPIDFPDGKPHPTQGAWFSRYRFERCGDAKLYNVLFVANRNGTAPTARAYYPGSTIASPELVNDAMPSVIAGALVRSGRRDCKEIDVFDMRVTEATHNVAEGNGTLKDVWSETWTFRMCGQMNDVAVTFISDANGGGTTFTSGPVKLGSAHGE